MRLKQLLVTVIVALAALTAPVGASAHAGHTTTLVGSVESDGTGLDGYKVTLEAIYVGLFGYTKTLGYDTTDWDGHFEITYKLPSWLPPSLQPILFVRAESYPVMLVSAIGQGPVEGPVVINERTTIATGFSFAQFVKGKSIKGNQYGMLNAVHMAANMANPWSGGIGMVLDLPPNGGETTARETFNSLANMIANCVDDSPGGCEDLFDATTIPGGSRPKNVLQAVASITKYPWSQVDTLYDLSTQTQPYGPALTAPPDAWTLFLKFTGSFSSEQTADNLINGPGIVVVDKKGFLWINNNYVPEPADELACPGNTLLKFYPWGEPLPHQPFTGGGLSGSGWGLSIAPNGRVWVGNFGFSGFEILGPGCPTPLANSVSLFKPNGTPISPDVTGYTEGPISWPQGTMTDRKSNLWIANCQNGTVTMYPRGRRHLAKVLDIPAANQDEVQPFGIAIDHKGNAWVAGNYNSSLTVFGPNGDLVDYIEGTPQLTRPMGVASDSKGNIWVANSDWMDVVCPPGPPDFGTGTNPSVALFLRHPDRQPHPDSPFSGAGMILPWGIAVDGDDTVWVANFGFPFWFDEPDSFDWPAPNRVSHLCGVDTSKCPPNKQAVGAAISPDDTGYTSNALDRLTGVTIDLSGNVWLANNWKQNSTLLQLNNPGGNSIAVIVGAAKPVKTPLIGTPRSFNHGFGGWWDHW